MQHEMKHSTAAGNFKSCLKLTYRPIVLYKLNGIGECSIRNKFQAREDGPGVIKPSIINALNTGRLWDESESAATGSWISGGWQVAPILRTDGCDGCNETQFCASVRHTWSLRWARCHGWFYGKRGWMLRSRDQKSSPLALNRGTSARLMRLRRKYPSMVNIRNIIVYYLMILFRHRIIINRLKAISFSSFVWIKILTIFNCISMWFRRLGAILSDSRSITGICIISNTITNTPLWKSETEHQMLISQPCFITIVATKLVIYMIIICILCNMYDFTSRYKKSR